MNNSSTLIVGATGQLGRALKHKYPHAKSTDSGELDITNKELMANFDWEGIKIIINAAAYTNVDGAETSEGRVTSWDVNATGVSNLVKYSLKHDILLIHVSSDYVFDGTKSSHKETELFSPINVYGQTKAAGDITVSLLPKHYILRTSWLIGEGKNFVKTMLDISTKGISPSVVNDQTGRLTFTSELLNAIDHLLTVSAEYGTYNISNDGETTSWADIAKAIYEEAALDVNVNCVSTNQYYAGKNNIAPRPAQSELDLTKIKSTGFITTDWREDLKRYISKKGGSL